MHINHSQDICAFVGSQYILYLTNARTVDHIKLQTQYLKHSFIWQNVPSACQEQTSFNDVDKTEDGRKISHMKTGQWQPAFCYKELFQPDSYFGHKCPICILPLQISSLTSADVYYKQAETQSSHRGDWKLLSFGMWHDIQTKQKVRSKSFVQK